MRLQVITLDYDGTIAVDGVLDPAVRSAIEQASDTGVRVVIVTGRILSELLDVAGGLEFVDGVVAENGAVASLPNGHTLQFASAPPMKLINELTERGIEFKVGRCVTELEATFADVVISLIRELELPLAITFNRNRMMLLPASISKATGQRELLDILGVSIHNAVGIGDAENDHELLQACEFGVAVPWGSQLLQEHADHVLAGAEPSAVAEFIERISEKSKFPLDARGHHRITLESPNGTPAFQIGIRGRSVLVAGDTRSGKSWLAGLLCEQMSLQRYTVFVFDPEGDYSSLNSLPNTIVLGGGRLLPKLDDLTMLLQQGLSVVLKLSHLKHDEKTDYIRHHLPLVADFRRRRGFPHRVLLDECHLFLRDEQLLGDNLHSFTLVTYRPSLLPQPVIDAVGVVASTRLSEPSEVDALRRLARTETNQTEWYELLGDLSNRESVLLPPTEEAKGHPRKFCVSPRLTRHVRHQSKYMDIPVSAGESFVFTKKNAPVGETAATLLKNVLAATIEQRYVSDGSSQA